MKHPHDGWYLLQDGTHADPKDVSRGKDGLLRNKNGLAVAMNADGTPQTLGAAAVENKNVEAAAAGKVEPPAPKPQPEAAVVADGVEVPPAPVKPAAKEDGGR